MGAFLYFVEKYKTQVTVSDVAELGLSYAFDSKPVACRVERGPSGNAGAVFCRDGTASPIGYYPKRQTWAKSEVGDFWIGWNGSEPKPGDLERPTMIAGRDVELATGDNWRIPVARSIDSGDASSLVTIPRLPCSMRYSGGEWVLGDVVPRFRRLWEIANRVFDYYIEAGGESGKLMIAFDDAVETLAANYYVGRDEVSALGLLTSSGPEFPMILRTLVDLDSFLEWAQKKTESVDAGEISQAGNAD